MRRRQRAGRWRCTVTVACAPVQSQSGPTNRLSSTGAPPPVPALERRGRPPSGVRCLALLGRGRWAAGALGAAPLALRAKLLIGHSKYRIRREKLKKPRGGHKNQKSASRVDG